jgi:predicted RNA binding protein YcfA (HicA-like mRNA interferase family)
MKRADLIRKLTELGCELIRHGGNHDWYQNITTKVCQPVPRHREIKERLAHSIIKKLS